MAQPLFLNPKPVSQKPGKITLLSLSVKKWRLGKAEKKISRHFHLRLKCT
jgi:hypothetical protein